MSESVIAAQVPARVLVMVEQPLIVEVIKLTLNHGIYVTREAQDVSEATAVLGPVRRKLSPGANWQGTNG